ncbi:hypothetical protein [Metallosphaera sedula]|uniref:hypothetical protein n=1 Tax=Metallosphaera sedula TaxID=43687 RepID=UPI00069FFA2D
MTDLDWTQYTLLWIQSQNTFWEKIAELVHSRRKIVIVESDLNDPRIVNPKEWRGYGIDAQ